MARIRVMFNFLCAATTEAGEDETYIGASLVSSKGKSFSNVPWQGTVNNANHKRYHPGIMVWEGDWQDDEIGFLTLHFLEDDDQAQQVVAQAAINSAAGATALVAGATVPVAGAIVALAGVAWSAVSAGSNDIIGSVVARFELKNGQYVVDHFPAVEARYSHYWEQEQPWPVLLYGDSGQYMPRVYIEKV